MEKNILKQKNNKLYQKEKDSIIDVLSAISQINLVIGRGDEINGAVDRGLRVDKTYSNGMFEVDNMDGFNVKLLGDNLILGYSRIVSLDYFHKIGVNKMEDEILTTINDVIKFIKKEFKKVMGRELSLKRNDDDIDIVYDYLNGQKSIMKAVIVYKVNNLSRYLKKEDNINKIPTTRGSKSLQEGQIFKKLLKNFKVD